MWTVVAGTPLWASRSQRILPVGKSRQKTSQRWTVVGGVLTSPPKYRPFLATGSLPSLTTVVRNTLSPQTTGDDQPRPGIGVCQTTFSEGPHWSGRVGLSAAMPRDWAPRNCGQLASSPRTAPGISIVSAITNVLGIVL